MVSTHRRLSPQPLGDLPAGGEGRTGPTTALIQKKICIVGPVSVGKTSLVARYVHSLFSDKYLSTVGVKIDKKTQQIDGRELMFILWDLAGDDDFQRLRTSYLRGAAGYLLVADGTRGATLEQGLEIQERVAKAVGPIPFVLVLNKADLAPEWEIDDRSIEALTKKGWMVGRTSAKDGFGVEAVFMDLGRRLLNVSQPTTPNTASG